MNSKTHIKKDKTQQQPALELPSIAPSRTTRRLKNIMLIVIAVFAIGLYANTLYNDYAVDDRSVTFENKIVQTGVKGIPEILINRYRQGYWDRKESMYRPLSVVVFAIEWQIAPNKPWVGHLFNILLYALTGVLLFLTLVKLLPKQNLIIPFVTTLLFIAHPIHTEVVVNIKSCDEMLCFLFSIASLYTLISYINSSKIISLLLSLFYFFLALLSKESAITWLAIVPLALHFFTSVDFKKIIRVTAFYVGVVVIYLIIRKMVLGDIGNHEAVVAINNSLVVAADPVSRFASAMHVMGKYLLLLFFPHPLVSDYSYNQIKNISINDIMALFPIAVYVTLVIYALKTFKQKNIKSFGILFFLITISLVSNIFFLIESVMAERFLYLPSLGFCLVIAFVLTELLKTDVIKNSSANIIHFLKNDRVLFSVIFIILILFSVKTISRNSDWKNDFVLAEHDVKISTQSARLLYIYGTALFSEKAMNEKDEQKKAALTDKSIALMERSISIFPAYRDAYLYLGVEYKEEKDTIHAIANFELAGRCKADFTDISFYSKIGDQYHDLKNCDEADSYYDTVLVYDPKNAVVLNNYSYDLSLRNEKLDKAEAMSKLANEVVPHQPFFEDTYSCILAKEGKYAEAEKSLKKAFSNGGKEIGMVLEHYGDLLYAKGDSAQAVEYWNKAKTKGWKLDITDKKIIKKKFFD